MTYEEFKKLQYKAENKEENLFTEELKISRKKSIIILVSDIQTQIRR